jgi:hypothetical protein
MTQESDKIGIKKTQQRSFTAPRRALMAVAAMTCFTLLAARANACGPSGTQGPPNRRASVAVLASTCSRATVIPRGQSSGPCFHCRFMACEV